MGRLLPILGAALLVVLACATPRWHGPVPEARGVEAAGIAADVAWLAADERQGRGLGSEGLAEAARFLAEGFREAGLEPGGPDGSFFQPFEMPIGIRLAESRLALDGEDFERGRDFEALLASDDAKGRFPVVFAGYGISDPESRWDDYAGVDLEGRAVLILDGRPPGEDGPLGGIRGGGFLKRAYKLLNAREHGAAAVLIAPAVAEEDAEGLPAGAGAERPNPTLASAGVPAVAVSRRTAARLLAAAGVDLDAAQAALDASGRPRSRALEGVEVELAVRVERERGEVVNVIGVRRGADPERADEAVVIGAHYDHLGEGAFGSLSPGRRGEIHRGADDNASGTAGLLALARAFGEGPPPQRSLVIAAFTAEEAGLVGSARYVAAPERGETAAMINLDMIGRLRDDTFTVFGAESSPGFPDLVERAAAGSGLTPTFEAGANGPSDQLSFFSAGIPVLFFFTGLHPDYHTPDDRPEKVNAEGEARLLGVVERVARALLDADERPPLVAAAPPPRERASGGGYGPYLGTVPAFGGPPVEGVRLQGVSPGSPAQRAGLRGGDVIVVFAGAPVRGLEEYAALLFASRPGRRVEIVVERDGERFATEAVLGQRR